MNQGIYNVVAVVAACIAIFWTLLQIVTYAREKDPKNLRITLFLVVIIAGGFLGYRHYCTMLRGAVPQPSAHTPVTTGSTFTPAPTVTTTSLSPVGNASTPAPSGSGGAESPVPSESAAIATPTEGPGSPAPTPEATEALPASPGAKAFIKPSFVAEVRRNVLGGIGTIVAQCAFAEIGGADAEIISYTITVNYSESGSGEITRSFERTLEKRIEVKANSTTKAEIPFDSEIGDLILKSRKSGNPGWIRMVWTAKDTGGAVLTCESTSNRPE